MTKSIDAISSRGMKSSRDAQNCAKGCEKVPHPRQR